MLNLIRQAFPEATQLKLVSHEVEVCGRDISDLHAHERAIFSVPNAPWGDSLPGRPV